MPTTIVCFDEESSLRPTIIVIMMREGAQRARLLRSSRLAGDPGVAPKKRFFQHRQHQQGGFHARTASAAAVVALKRGRHLETTNKLCCAQPKKRRPLQHRLCFSVYECWTWETQLHIHQHEDFFRVGSGPSFGRGLDCLYGPWTFRDCYWWHGHCWR